MADKNQSDISQDVESLRDVAEDLAELLTNSVNMVDKYYEIFFDTTPHYVELQQYDSDGQLRTTLVPNRAMDKTIALSGEEDPENVVEAQMGALYINTVTRELFLKKTASGKIGWENITPQRIDMYKETFNVDSTTTNVQLLYKPYSKDYMDAYINGTHLEYDDYDIEDDGRTIDFHVQFPDNSTLQVSYLDGLYGIKGDTALTFRVGDVAQVPSDQPPRVENVGTSKDIVLEFDIPKGADGDNGIYVGPDEPPADKEIWIDTSATGYNSDELGVSRIFDSGINVNVTAYRKACQIMHNSIDTTKYTLLGNAFVNDEGLLTVVENEAGLRTNVKVEQLTNQNWSISGRDYIDVDAGAFQYMFTIGSIDGQGCSFQFKSSDHSFKYTDRNNNQSTVLFTNTDMYETYGKGWYNWKVEFKDNRYYFALSYGSNDLAIQAVKVFSNVNQPANEYVYIAGEDVYYHSASQSDLKVFAVYVNGTLLYTPNKTGIHYIYNDHFDKVGSPILTDIGILTEIMNGEHFIYGDFKAGDLKDKPWDIQGHFKHIGTPEVLWQFADPENIEASPLDVDEHSGDYKMLSAVVEDNNKLVFYLVTGVTGNRSTTHHFDFNLTLNKEYYYKMSHLIGTKYVFTLSENKDFSNPTVLTYNANTENPNPYVSNVFPDYQIVMGTNNTLETEVKPVYNNLNYFKINTYDAFAYRPLLRIPVTFAKTGALFVEPSQRAVVQEAYTIHGIGNIYVLDEVNHTITLPLSDIYSLIEKEYQSRPTIGKGLLLDERKNLLENLTEGLEIGDVGESVVIDESIGTRRILNGQIVDINDSLKDFFEFVKSLRSKGLVVTEAEWQAEAELSPLNDCNKFVINSTEPVVTEHFYGYIPDSFIIRTPIIPDEDPELEPTEEEPTEPQPIEYETHISPDLTEADIVYTTSQDPLTDAKIYNKINNILYPKTDVTQAEILDESLYYRYDVADFERDNITEVVTSVRIPHITSEKTGYNYYIQVATGVKNNVNVENDFQVVSPYAYGMYQYADVDINCPGWLLSNGTWYDGDTYISFYEWIVAQAKLHKEHFALYNNPEYSVTNYDFVAKEEDRTFRLPNIANACDYSKLRFLVEKKEPTESDRSWYNLYSDGWLEQGNYQQLFPSVARNWANGPTITMPKPYLSTAYHLALCGLGINDGGYGTGYNIVFVNNKQWYLSAYNTGSSSGNWTAMGYAQKPAFDTYRHLFPRLYYYVGDTVQTRKHINYGELANEVATIKSAPILTAPRKTYQEIPCPASGQTITSPGNGWIYFKRTSTATNQYLGIYDAETGMGELQWIAANNNWAQTIVPAYEGQIFTVNYSAGTHNFLRFVASDRRVR